MTASLVAVGGGAAEHLGQEFGNVFRMIRGYPRGNRGEDRVIMAEVLERSLFRLLGKFEGRLPEEDYQSIRALLEHREWGVGLENLCTQLYEHSIPVAEGELAAIRELAVEMELPEQIWNFLDED